MVNISDMFKVIGHINVFIHSSYYNRECEAFLYLGIERFLLLYASHDTARTTYDKVVQVSTLT
jgi:hypothetical protein